MAKDETFTYEERHDRKGFLSQPCSTCNLNWDFNLKGRTLQCPGCGSWQKEDPKKKNKLIRVG